jgi:predicted dehydrogenase
MVTRVGFIGTGFIARFHAGSLSVCGVPFECGPCFDVDAEKAAAFGADFGYSFAGAVDEVLDGCDAVYITTWTSEHGVLVDAAVARGIHVFVEKPLAVDAPGADVIARACEDAGVVAQVGLVLRRSPTFGLARELLRDPAAGRPMAVVFRDDQFIPNRGHYGSTWRVDASLAGRGTLLEHSIHDVDMLQWLLGPVSAVSCTTREHHGYDRIDDLAAARLEFDSGAVVQLTSVWHDIMERGSLRHVEVFCDNLYVKLEDDRLGPIRWEFSGEPEQCLEGEATLEFLRKAGDRMPSLERNFLTAIRDGGAATPTLRDAVSAHQIVDALYASADGGGGVVTDVYRTR